MKAFFADVGEDEDANLLDGVGVYIVSAEDEPGRFIPWYVGRTRTTFRRRIRQHYKSERFKKLLDRGPISFLLLARASHGKALPSEEAIRGHGRKSIALLELVLIGTCLKINPFLLNKQETSFHRVLHVPGYIDNSPEERDFPAAQALSKLLGT